MTAYPGFFMAMMFNEMSRIKPKIVGRFDDLTAPFFPRGVMICCFFLGGYIHKLQKATPLKKVENYIMATSRRC